MGKSSIKQILATIGTAILVIAAVLACGWYVYTYLQNNWTSIAIGAGIVAVIGVGMGIKHLLAPKESK